MAPRIIGNRRERPISAQPSAERLGAGTKFCSELAGLGNISTFVRKGVYRFRTHAQAEEHRIETLARGLAARAAGGAPR
jgi:hypothetical protein